MSFYKRRQPPAMGFAWIAPIVQLVGGALQSHPADPNYVPPDQSNGLAVAAASLGGLALVGGILYFVWKRA